LEENNLIKYTGVKKGLCNFGALKEKPKLS